MGGNEIVMGGHGFYNAHSQLQHSAISYGLPFLQRALTEVALPTSDRPFVVADYGSSEGRNSMEVMAIVVREVRRRAPATFPISIVHVDQPANDFSSLFMLLQSSPASYLCETQGVFAYATGGTFYGRLFPDGQVSLGWSSIAIHWLSRLPATDPDHIASGHSPPHIFARFSEQAREDWECFLTHRAHELRTGGRLVVVGGSADAQGTYGGEPLYDVANRILQQLVRDGYLRAQEYARMMVPTYHRTPEEFAEPLQQGTLRGRLLLEAQSQVTMPDPLWEQFGKAGDIQSFASKQTAWLRAWSEPSLFRHLDADRSPDNSSRIIEEFYGRVRLAIVQDPLAARCNWKISILLIAKP